MNLCASAAFVHVSSTAVFHFVANWLLFSLFDLTGFVGRCLLSLLAACAAILHIVPVWAPAVPGVLELWITYERLDIPAVFFIVHSAVTSRGSDLLMKEMAGDLHINPLVIGMSVYCGGLIVMPGLRGILLGPLILLLVLRLWRIVHRRVDSDDSRVSDSSQQAAHSADSDTELVTSCIPMTGSGKRRSCSRVPSSQPVHTPSLHPTATPDVGLESVHWVKSKKPKPSAEDVPNIRKARSVTFGRMPVPVAPLTLPSAAHAKRALFHDRMEANGGPGADNDDDGIRWVMTPTPTKSPGPLMHQ